MTEQQREDDLLANLLEHPTKSTGTGDTADFDAIPVLTRNDELALLNEAHQVGTPMLTPTPEGYDNAPASFAADIVGIVRRYPLPAVLAGAGLVMLLARRRR
jgi:hypothetical protein